MVAMTMMKLSLAFTVWAGGEVRGTHSRNGRDEWGRESTECIRAQDETGHFGGESCIKFIDFLPFTRHEGMGRRVTGGGLPGLGLALTLLVGTLHLDDPHEAGPRETSRRPSKAKKHGARKSLQPQG